MTRFFAIDPKENRSIELSFTAFLDVAKGATFKSAAMSDNFIEIGLDGEINMRVEAGPDGSLHVFLFSTLNDDDIPSLRIQIVADDEAPSAALVEQRIRALRQSYAIAYLIGNDRAEAVEQALAANPMADLETDLLDASERLYIASAAPGSFWLTVITKSSKAYQAAKYALALPYIEGRNALLRRVQADTRLKELAVEEKELEIGLRRAKGALDVLGGIEKVKHTESRNLIRKSFLENLNELNAPVVFALPPSEASRTEDSDD